VDYYFSIFVRDLTADRFYNINDTIEKFSGTIVQSEKDIIIGKSMDINILSCLVKMKDSYSEARFGISQYVGLAKGLSKIAKFGEILVSEEIEQQIIDLYDITSLGMLSIEGMTSQLLVCKIENPRGDLTFPEPKEFTCTISRKQEAESIQNLLRVSNAVLIVAHPGSGKTVFIDHLVNGWKDRAIYRTFCPSYAIGSTLKPIIDIVTQILGIFMVESIEEQQRIIESTLRKLEIFDIGTSYLAILDFLGLNEEESILEKLELKTRVDIITESIAETVKRISWTEPVTIIVEDVEYMDSSSRTFVQQLMKKLADENVCFIFSASIPQVDISGLQEFELRAIDKTALEDLIEQYTDERINLPPTTPFHVVQYLLLYRDEKIRFLYEQYRGTSSLTNFSLPFYDIHTTIKRRVDMLSDDRKEFFYNLTVAGIELTPGDLPIDKKSFHLFDYFVERNFIKKYHNSYLFTSPVLHEEVYNLIQDKQARHTHLADYYRRLQGFEEHAAFHYLHAENHKKAIEFLMKSAQHAIQKGGYESGIYYYNQALDLCQRQKDAADLEILVALNEGLADVYRALGDEDKALKYYKVVLDSYKEILKE
jgi:tetratricopeptide (TPR) repeat protein